MGRPDKAVNISAMAGLENYEFKGLPQGLERNILWVDDQYRTNPLHTWIGGSRVIVQYANGSAYGYKGVIYPSRYIAVVLQKTWEEENPAYKMLSDQDKLTWIKKVILRVFAQKPDQISYTQEYECAWDALDSNMLPWDSLKRFDKPFSGGTRIIGDPIVW